MEESRLENAAVQAELDTGQREESVAKAKAHIVVRLARMCAGTLLILAGIAMLVLPGPGLLAIAGGLGLISLDVAWADRFLRYLRRQVPGMPEEGPIPRSTIIVSGFLLAPGAAVSFWWFSR